MSEETEPDIAAPRIIGEIGFSQPSGQGGLRLYRNDVMFQSGYPWQGPVALYAWSDGVVTWTRERT